MRSGYLPHDARPSGSPRDRNEARKRLWRSTNKSGMITMGRAYKVKVPGQETRTTLRINAKEQEVEANTRGGGKHVWITRLGNSMRLVHGSASVSTMENTSVSCSRKVDTITREQAQN